MNTLTAYLMKAACILFNKGEMIPRGQLAAGMSLVLLVLCVCVCVCVCDSFFLLDIFLIYISNAILKI